MVKKHLKRLAMPKSWKIKRGGIKFITRPSPGPHPLRLSLSLKSLLRDILKIGKTTKEVRFILNKRNILVDGIRRTDPKFPVGFMDTIEVKEAKQFFRIILDKKGKLSVINISSKESNLKPCKIINKSKVKGKTQLNLYDGRNILVEDDKYKIGDTILITIPKQEIKDYIKLEKGCFIYLIGGKHSGSTGTVEDISGNKIVYKSDNGELIETLKKYVFVLGKAKPAISITNKKVK